MSSPISCENNDCIDQFEENVECSSILKNLNDLRNQLNTISIYELKFIKNFEEWICQVQKLINKFCNDKSNQHFDKMKEVIDHLNNIIQLLIKNLNTNDDRIHYIEQIIQLIEQNLNEIRNVQSQLDQSIISIPTLMEDINVSPLIEPNEPSCSSLENENDRDSCLSSSNQSNCSSTEFCSYHFCLSPRTSFYPYLISPKETINIPSDNWSTLCTNENHLLIIGKCKIILFNQKFNIVNEKSFFHQGIKDICWSKTLDRFVLISPKQIYTLDEKSMIIQPLKFYFNINSCWERGTCSDTSLFLSTFGQNPFIVLLDFFPSIQFNKRYQSEIISHEYQFINDIKYNSNNLAIIIEDGLINQTYFQLHSVKSFQCIWIVSLGEGWGYRSSLFNYRYWIISDYYNNRFIHILNDGIIIKIENYFTKPFNIVPWNNNQIIIRTMENINIHQSQ